MKSAFYTFIIILGILLGIKSTANAQQGDIIPTACATATYTLSPGTTIHFYDDGGPGGDCTSGGSVANGNFANSGCETVTTICPAPGETLDVDFLVLSMFATASGFDWMVIYEGPNTSGNILFDNRSGGPDNPNGTSCNYDNTAQFCISDECLTFRFYASSVVNREGWDAVVSSSPPTGSGVVNVDVTAPTCSADGFAEITNYDNNLNYTFTPAGPTIAPSGEITGATFGQSYTVEIDNAGCGGNTVTFQIEEQLVTPVAPNIDITAPTCFADGFAEITNYDAGSNYTFTPAGPSIIASGEITGATFGQNYSVEVDNNSGCGVNTATFQIEEQLVTPDDANIDVTDPTCTADGFAEIINYDAGLNYTFTPVGPTIAASGEITGANFGQNYSVDVDNNTGCAGNTATFQIEEQLVTLDAPDIDVTDPTCTSDGFAEITNYDTGSNYTFTPAGPSIIASGEITGAAFGQNYSVEVGNNSGCGDNTATFQIEEQLITPDAPDIDVTDPNCTTDGFAQITNYDVESNYTFTPVGPTIAASGEIIGATFGQNYSVEVDNNSGCGINTATFQVEEQFDTPAPDFFVDEPEGCSPHAVTFIDTSGTSNATCTWDFGDGNTSNSCDTVSHTYEGEGVYDVTLTIENALGCEGTTTTTSYIEVTETPNASFTADPQITDINDTEVNFTNTTLGGFDFEWDFGDQSENEYTVDAQHVYPNEEGDSYVTTLIASNGSGCADTARLVIKVEDEIIFYVPNTFTPDGDPLNQTFQPIFTSGYDPQDFHMIIFNRWGEVIFETYDVSVGWDGKYSNFGYVKDGTYIWTIEFKETMSDKRHYEQGHINILR